MSVLRSRALGALIGAELISPFMDWSDRNVAVLFGDGAAAVVLQATEGPQSPGDLEGASSQDNVVFPSRPATEGLLAEKLGCYGEAREILRKLRAGKPGSVRESKTTSAFHRV